MPRAFAIRALLIGACLATCAWGGVQLHAKAQARTFSQWRSDANHALHTLTTREGAKAAPAVRHAQAAGLQSAATRHNITLRTQGSVLRIPTDVLVELDGLGVLAIVPGPAVEGEPTCMVLTDDGKASFAPLAMLDRAFARAVHLRR
jgi:glucose/arabinose dehydrogenase